MRPCHIRDAAAVISSFFLSSTLLSPFFCSYNLFNFLSFPQVEVEGMRQCHIRDAAAVVSGLCWLEEAMEKQEHEEK